MGRMSQLYQDRTWTSKDGETRLITEMTEAHLRNTLRLIERVGPALLERAIMEYIWGPQPSGEWAQECFGQEFDALLDATPGEYVDELPSVVAMRRRLEEIKQMKHELARMTP